MFLLKNSFILDCVISKESNSIKMALPEQFIRLESEITFITGNSLTLNIKK